MTPIEGDTNGSHTKAFQSLMNLFGYDVNPGDAHKETPDSTDSGEDAITELIAKAWMIIMKIDSPEAESWREMFRQWIK